MPVATAAKIQALKIEHASDPGGAGRLLRLIVYRCFAWRKRRRGAEEDGPLWFPRAFQGEGTHNNPDFDRAGEALRLLDIRALTAEDQAVMNPAEFLGLRA